MNHYWIAESDGQKPYTRSQARARLLKVNPSWENWSGQQGEREIRVVDRLLDRIKSGDHPFTYLPEGFIKFGQPIPDYPIKLDHEFRIPKRRTRKAR